MNSVNCSNMNSVNCSKLTPASPSPLTRHGAWCAALALTLLAAGCAKDGGEPRSRGRAQGPVPVLVAPVTRQEVPIALTAVGTVEASASVAVRARTEGHLLRIAFRAGAPVRQGQVLFELERGELQASLARAEATLAKDLALAEQARAEAARYTELAAQGFVPRVQAEQQRTSAAALDATVRADRAAVADAQLQLAHATIRAPIDGVAGDVPLHAGDLVRPSDAAPLVTINRARPALVAFSLPESQIATLKRYVSAGERPRIEAKPRGADTASTGTLSFIDNTVDPTSGMLKLRGTSPNQGGQLVPGQFVDVRLVLADEMALTVPTAAVLTGQKGPYVYVLQPEQTVAARPVVLERQAGDRAVIAQGLEPGESVVIDGQVRLSPGAKVKVQKDLTPVPPREAAKDARPKRRESP